MAADSDELIEVAAPRLSAGQVVCKPLVSIVDRL